MRPPIKTICMLATMGCVMSTGVYAQDDFLLEEEDITREAPWKTQIALDYSSEVEIGAGYVSDDSFKFGEFNGLEDEGVHFIGNADIRWSDAFDSDSSRYFELQAADLGLDTREVYMEYGHQGRFALSFGYDEIPKRITDSARTPFLGAGGTTLTLPALWDPGTTTAGMDNLVTLLKSVDIDHEREKYSAGGKLILFENWNLALNFSHEDKEGSKTIGAVIGVNGGNPRAVVVPEPVDYATDEVELLIGYSGRRLQAQFRYHASLFDNDAETLTWDNPYSAIGGWNPVAGFPTGQGRLALPPDNDFHQVSFTGAYQVTPTTRATLTASTGWMTQDEDFLPFTVNPLLATPVPLPRESLDGEIQTTLIDAAVVSRPLPRLDLQARFRYDDRDNDTPQAEYFVVHGDAADQDTEARINLPYSYEQTQARFDAGYLLMPRTRLEIGYRYETIERDFQEVDETTEHTGSLNVNGTPLDFVNVRLTYEHGSRRGDSSYDGTIPLLASHEPSTVPPGDFENHPLLRKFHLADRDRDRLLATVTVIPHEMVNLGLNVNYVNDDYDDGLIGLKSSRTEAYSADVSVIPNDRVSAYLFYTYEDLTADIGGWSFQGFAKIPHSQDPTRQWFVDHKDIVHTVGGGVDLELIPDRLFLDADYVYARSRGDIGVTTGPSLASAPLPDLETERHELTVSAEYNLRKNVGLRLGYLYGKYNSADFALDFVAPNTLANVITLGEESPEYSTHVFWAAVKYRF